MFHDFSSRVSHHNLFFFHSSFAWFIDTLVKTKQRRLRRAAKVGSPFSCVIGLDAVESHRARTTKVGRHVSAALMRGKQKEDQGGFIEH